MGVLVGELLLVCRVSVDFYCVTRYWFYIHLLELTAAYSYTAYINLQQPYEITTKTPLTFVVIPHTAAVTARHTCCLLCSYMMILLF